MLRHWGKRPHRPTPIVTNVAPLQWPDPGISTTPATAVPSSAAAGSTLALVVTDGTDGTTNGNRWYAWNETTKSLGADLGAAGSIASDTESVTRPNFIYGNSGSTLDLVVIYPRDAYGLNPQRTAGFGGDGGLVLQNWNRIRIYSGEVDVRIDYVKASNGIGLNMLNTTTTSTLVSGGGFHDERMRALRIRNYNSVHIEGVKFGGANLYEAIDVSHGNSASSVFQVQRCQFGTATQHIKNLRSFYNFYTNNDGTLRQQYYPTYDHSGGDCIQCWTGPLGQLRFADNEYHSDFQAMFLAWDDQSGSALAPAFIDVRRNEIHQYLSTRGPWLYYDTKSSTLAPPPAYFEDNFIHTPNYVAKINTLVKTGGYGGGTFSIANSGTYANYEGMDWLSSGLPAGSQHNGAPAWRTGVPLLRLGPNGTTASGRTGAQYDPNLWTVDNYVAPASGGGNTYVPTYVAGF